MADKIVQVTASKITATNVVYTPKLVDLPVPKLVVGNAQPVEITTSVENPKLTGTVTNMGEESIPNPSLFKRLNDSYTGTDTVSLRYLQTKLEQVLVPDLFSRVVDYRRVFEEAQVTSDSYRVSFVNKGLVTLFNTLDVSAKTLAKPFVDSSNLSEVSTKTVAKAVFSQVTYSEELIKVAYLKTTSEVVVSAEDFRRQVDYQRNFQDVVDSTDDFFGTANADDDQIARVGKTLVNWVASSEVRIVDVSKVLADQAASQEQKSVELTKPFISQSTLSSLTTLSFAKPLSSLSTLADQYSYEAYKNLEHIFVTVDQKTIQVAKTVTDQADLSEQKQFSLQKPLVSTATSSDTVLTTWLAQRQFADQGTTTTQIYLEFGKQLEHGLLATEQNQKSAGKVLSSTSATSDQLNSQVDYKRSFLDFVVSTDDFFGNANIDDDQTARIGKNVVNLVLPVEQHSIVGSKVLSTQYSASEQAAIQTSKTLSSIFGSEELVVYDLDKVLLDTSTASEQQSFSVSKPLTTSFASTDTFNRTVIYNRQPTDQFNTDDTVIRNVNKGVITVTAATEQITTQTDFKRQLISLADSTELAAKILRTPKQDLVLLPEQVRKRTTKVLHTNVLQQNELVQKTPKKTILSQATTGENISFFKFGNRFFNEIATTNDSGVINNQGYFAESYVEPGYAGTNTYIS